MGLRRSTAMLLPAVLVGITHVFVFDGKYVQAEICTTEKFYDGSLLHFSLCTVPDIDQRREESPPFVAALPNGGKMYCFPTATMNWMAYIANHGYPAIPPGPGDWGPEAGPFHPHYESMTAFLLQMGDLMGTDPTEGTNGGGVLLGTQLWLNSLLSTGDFVVSAYYASGHYSPRFIDLGKAAVDGSLVTVSVGWYVPWSEAPQYLKDAMLLVFGKLPKGLYRDGGHGVSMVSARNDFQFQQIGLHDPARPNDGLNTSQSPFTRDVYHVVDEQDTFDFYVRAQSRIESLAANAYIDGYFRIKPKYGLTADKNLLHLIRPIFLNVAGVPGEASLTSFQSATGGDVRDVAIHPERTVHPYLVEGENTIWQLDALTGQSTRFATVGNPRRLVFGGPEQHLYVLLPKHLIALGTDGIQKARVQLQEPLSDVTYDSARGRVVGIAEDTHTVYLFDNALHPIDVVRLATPFCRGDASAATDPRTGIIWLHCKGSPVLTRLRIGDTRFGKTSADITEVFLEGAQSPTAITLDDSGHLFVADGGVLAVYVANGTRVARSPFAGFVAGQSVEVLRSFSNFDARTMTGVRFRNVLPEDARQ